MKSSSRRDFLTVLGAALVSPILGSAKQVRSTDKPFSVPLNTWMLIQMEVVKNFIRFSVNGETLAERYWDRSEDGLPESFRAGGNLKIERQIGNELTDPEYLTRRFGNFLQTMGRHSADGSDFYVVARFPGSEDLDYEELPVSCRFSGVYVTE